jgi:phosphate transport system permease protein
VQQIRERLFRRLIILCTWASLVAVGLICLFLLLSGLPALLEIGPMSFLLGTEWRPLAGLYGILPMIMGSIWVTAGAMAMGLPVGLLTAVFLARFCPEWLHRILSPMVGLLAAIPSVVYGFFGIAVLVPAVRQIGGHGSSMFTAMLLLAIMILPTVISVSEAALRAVPDSYYEGALALGATHERSVFFTVLPAARSGVLAGVVLGVGRAIGETMAVVMVAGNQPRMPKGLLAGVRTLTANIVLEMGYAVDLHRGALIATGLVLFIFILLLNQLLASITRKEER